MFQTLNSRPVTQCNPYIMFVTLIQVNILISKSASACIKQILETVKEGRKIFTLKKKKSEKSAFAYDVFCTIELKFLHQKDDISTRFVVYG